MKYTWNKKKKKKSKIKNDNQTSIISEEINEVETMIIEKEKTCDFLEKESFLTMQDAEKKKDEFCQES